MRKTLVVVLGLLLGGIFANAALAANGTGGYVEICKAANPALTGTFQFTVHDSVGDSSPIVIGLGTCTQPMAVAPGAVTVTENGSLTGLTNQGTPSTTPDTSFLKVPTITAVGPNGSASERDQLHVYDDRPGEHQRLDGGSHGHVQRPARPGLCRGLQGRRGGVGFDGHVPVHDHRSQRLQPGRGGARRSLQCCHNGSCRKGAGAGDR